MKVMKVKPIVREKMGNASFAAMLSLFMKFACSVESQHVARLVGNVDNDKEQFSRQCEEQFAKLLAIQNIEGMDVLDVEKLSSAADVDHCMKGLHIEDLCVFFKLFDKNGDVNVDLEEFRIMIQSSRAAANLFT